jgi:hypothetical protein
MPQVVAGLVGQGDFRGLLHATAFQEKVTGDTQLLKTLGTIKIIFDHVNSLMIER